LRGKSIIKKGIKEIAGRLNEVKRVLTGASRVIALRLDSIVIAGWEASGSTFLAQSAKLLGLSVRKTHGKNNFSTEPTLFPFRDPRDIITSNAQRVYAEIWQKEGAEKALCKSLEVFIEARNPQALYESRQMPNVIFIRYENYFLKNEALLISMIADQFLIPLDNERLAHILAETSLEANLERSKRFDTFKAWDKDTMIHGMHISNKGLCGGWKKCFTPTVVERTKQSLGKLLIDLGYEKDYNWTL